MFSHFSVIYDEHGEKPTVVPVPLVSGHRPSIGLTQLHFKGALRFAQRERLQTESSIIIPLSFFVLQARTGACSRMTRRYTTFLQMVRCGNEHPHTHGVVSAGMGSSRAKPDVRRRTAWH